MSTQPTSPTVLARAAGTLMLLGTLAWTVTFSLWPSNSHHNSRAELAGGLVFQLGLAAYLAVLAAHRGAGDRWGPRILAGEGILLALAAIWSVGTILDPRTHQSRLLFALDVSWPLSMLGLVVVAVAVLRAGRLGGISRFAPLAASMWLLADGVGAAAGAGRQVHVTWLLASYGWLSVVLLRGEPRAAAESASSSPLARPTADWGRL